MHGRVSSTTGDGPTTASWMVSNQTCADCLTYTVRFKQQAIDKKLRFSWRVWQTCRRPFVADRPIPMLAPQLAHNVQLFGSEVLRNWELSGLRCVIASGP